MSVYGFFFSCFAEFGSVIGCELLGFSLLVMDSLCVCVCFGRFG